MSEFERSVERMLEIQRIRAAERKKEREAEAEMLNKGMKAVSASMAAKMHVVLEKAKVIVTERLRLELERLTEKSLPLDTLQERYDLFSQAKEQAVLQLQTNKLHRRFEDQSVENTARDTMWGFYAQLDFSNLQHVADYQTARELYQYLKPHVKVLGDKLMQEKREIKNAQVDHEIKVAVQTEPVALTQYKSKLTNEVNPETATAGNSEDQATSSKAEARLGRPKRNERSDRTLFGLFQDSTDAVRILKILLERGVVEAYFAGKKLEGSAYKDEEIKGAVFKMIGTNGNKNEIAALAQTIKDKEYLKAGSTREMARVFSSFFHVDVDESAYRKLILDDISNYYKKLIPKRLLPKV